jgi:hypothetical protein
MSRRTARSGHVDLVAVVARCAPAGAATAAVTEAVIRTAMLTVALVRFIEGYGGRVRDRGRAVPACVAAVAS